jgi:hypothetical protein
MILFVYGREQRPLAINGHDRGMDGKTTAIQGKELTP